MLTATVEIQLHENHRAMNLVVEGTLVTKLPYPDEIGFIQKRLEKCYKML